MKYMETAKQKTKVRKFQVTCDVDAVKMTLAGGTRAEDEVFSLSIHIRNNGHTQKIGC
jgi:hypothetical protein